jgi:hypothetical protein
VLSIAALISLLLLLTILYFSIFIPHRPILAIDSISEQQQQQQQLPWPESMASFHGGPFSSSSAFTICLNISISNPNSRATFYYDNVGSSLRYNGQELGLVMVPGGGIRPKATLRISVFLTPTGPSLPPSIGEAMDHHHHHHLLTLDCLVSVAGDLTYLGSFSHHVAIATHCILTLSREGVVAYTCNQLS